MYCNSHIDAEIFSLFEIYIWNFLRSNISPYSPRDGLVDGVCVAVDAAEQPPQKYAELVLCNNSYCILRDLSKLRAYSIETHSQIPSRRSSEPKHITHQHYFSSLNCWFVNGQNLNPVWSESESVFQWNRPSLWLVEVEREKLMQKKRKWIFFYSLWLTLYSRSEVWEGIWNEWISI